MPDSTTSKILLLITARRLWALRKRTVNSSLLIKTKNSILRLMMNKIRKRKELGTIISLANKGVSDLKLTIYIVSNPIFIYLSISISPLYSVYDTEF